VINWDGEKNAEEDKNVTSYSYLLTRWCNPEAIAKNKQFYLNLKSFLVHAYPDSLFWLKKNLIVACLALSIKV